jgi:hypothetical protein
LSRIYWTNIYKLSCTINKNIPYEMQKMGATRRSRERSTEQQGEEQGEAKKKTYEESLMG